ncbi:MAG: BamA/TamA family outer membrane protein [Bacteroidota bacterium]
MLKTNSVKIDGESKVSSSELESIIKQRPNRNIGFSLPVPSIWGSPYKWDVILLRFNLRAYNIGLRGKGKFFLWLRDKVGEPPVAYDTALTSRSVVQMNEYMFQKGYFNSKTRVETKTNRAKKMIRVAYIVDPGTPYLINSLKTVFPDERLQSLYNETFKESLIINGEIYDYDVLEKERQRMVTHYQNNGYYYFTREYIRFDVDSALNDHKVNLTMVVKNRIIRTDSAGVSKTQTVPHTYYYNRYYYVYPEYDFFANQQYTDTITKDSVKIVYNNKLPINQKLVYNNLLFPGTWYSQFDANETYRSFSSLNLYRNIKIEFKEAKNDPNRNRLDGYIYLSPFKRNSFTSEARLETRAANGSSNGSLNIGVSGNISFQKRNAFRNGEILGISLAGGLEPFFLNDSAASRNFFNTVEFGPTVSLSFPRFLLPISQDRFSKSARAKTIVAISYNILQNEDIRRRASKLTLTYEWNESAKKKHSITPAEFSLVKADLSTALDKRLNELGDPFLKNTYNSQFILASSYTYIYSDQYDNKADKALYNRSKIEGAGNALRELAQKIDSWEKTESGSYLIAGIPFAQYLKIENEFKTYRKTFFNNVVAFRLFAGAAKPYKNLGSLPFEKSYFAGGSNGIRAWGARSLGPGAYLDTNTFRGFLNRLGEIRLEGNIEYRFKITKLLEWAFFADAGNIWVFKETGNRTNTEFSHEFYKQIALGAGFGARFDLDFLIFRIDVAFPLRDPSMPEGEKWFYQDKEEYNGYVSRYNERNALSGRSAIRSYRVRPNFNIGIGYPF